MLYQYQNIQDKLSPPSPIISISIRNPNSRSKNVKIKAIVDTGSGITAIPENIVASLGRLNYSSDEFKNPLDKGQIVMKKIYSVIVELDNTKTHELEVLPIPRKYGIIGRDILNQYKVILNAPRHPESIWGFNCEDICDIYANHRGQ